jgi:hypothetical protein
MGGMSSQIVWKQAWSPSAESTLRQALGSQSCVVRELPSQHWEASTQTIGGLRDHMTSYLAPAADSWSSVLLHLNSLVAETVAAELSRLTVRPAIAIFEYDQAAWGYCLFESGGLLDRFWSLPDVVETPPDECVGRAGTVASLFGIPAQSIAPYITHITESDYGTKAFDDDEFTLGNHWVRVDFMRRLGIPYPSPGEVRGGRYVQIQEQTR